MSKVGAGALLFLWICGLGLTVHAEDRQNLQTLSLKAENCVQAGEYAQALALLEQACGLGLKIYGPRHFEMGMLLNNRAWVAAQAGKFQQAAAWYREALAILEQQLPGDDPELADSYAEAGRVFLDLGSFPEAETVLVKAWNLRRKILSPTHPDIVRTCALLAELRQAQRRYTESEDWLRQAGEKAKQCWGPQALETLAVQDQLASLYSAQKRFAEAALVSQTSLLNREQAFGSSDLRLLDPMFALAEVCRQQGALDDSAAWLDRALELAKSGGLESADLAEALNRRGRLFCEQGEPDEAEPLLETGLGIREKRFGPDHPCVAESCSSLAEACDQAGETDRAETLFLRAMNLLEASYGPQHCKTAEVAARLAGLYEEQGRYREAAVLYRSAAAGLETRYGPEDPAVQDVRTKLAQVETRMKKAGAAAEE